MCWCFTCFYELLLLPKKEREKRHHMGHEGVYEIYELCNSILINLHCMIFFLSLLETFQVLTRPKLHYNTAYVWFNILFQAFCLCATEPWSWRSVGWTLCVQLHYLSFGSSWHCWNPSGCAGPQHKLILRLCQEKYWSHSACGVFRFGVAKALISKELPALLCVLLFKGHKQELRLGWRYLVILYTKL